MCVQENGFPVIPAVQASEVHILLQFEQNARIEIGEPGLA